MASIPGATSSDFSRIPLDATPQDALDTHPLDPAASFVYIDAPLTRIRIDPMASSSQAPKTLPSSSLEDGWDFVEASDDRIDDMTFTKVPRSSPHERHKTTSDSNNLSASFSKLGRNASSMPPLSGSSSSKASSSTSPHSHLGPLTHDQDRYGPKSRKDRAHGASKHRNTELTQNSGFKHRIYCTLYNLYHAQASEAPALSNSPVFMMGAILQPTSELDSGTKSASTSPTSAQNSSPRQRYRTGKHPDASKSSRDDFLDMCRTLLYFSYRKDFSRLDVFNVTSDVGWGCMLRTGQMLLATALQRLHEPIVASKTINNYRNRARISGNEMMSPGASQVIAQLILDWFRDYPDLDRHPYSIHNLVGTSLTLNPPGEDVSGPSWFSPTKLARILRFLVRMHSPEGMTMYVPPEGVIYMDEVIALCTEEHRSTINPSTDNVKNDRTMLWWQRFSAGGPAVSRTLTLAYEDSDSEASESEPSLDVNDIENDALYQRALAESLAQEEIDNEDSSSSSPAFRPSSPSSLITSSSGGMPGGRAVDDSLLAWTVREWNETGTQAAGTTSVSAPPGRTSLSASTGAVPRHSHDSSNSLDSSVAWVHLPIVRADLGNERLDTLMDEYSAAPSSYAAHSSSLNLSALVENHEDLQGEPKPSTKLQLQAGDHHQGFGLRSRGNSTGSRPHSPVPGHLMPPSTPSNSHISSSPSATTSSSPLARAGTSGTNPIRSPGKSGSSSPSSRAALSDDSFVLLSASEASSNQSKTPSVARDFWKPLLLLIPSRLGVSKINPAYIDHLKFSLSSSSSVGIVGGKPNKSLYFFAYQDDFVFYLDPHFVHNTVKPIDNRGQIHDSYKVKFPSKIKFFDLDPSLALGFFLRTRADFEAFCHAHHTFAVQCQGDPTCEPIFTIQDTAPDYLKG